MSRLSSYFAGFNERLRAARFSDVLNRMSDRQLADIGFSRDDIPRHAREMARR